MSEHHMPASVRAKQSRRTERRLNAAAVLLSLVAAGGYGYKYVASSPDKAGSLKISVAQPQPQVRTQTWDGFPVLERLDRNSGEVEQNMRDPQPGFSLRKRQANIRRDLPQATAELRRFPNAQTGRKIVLRSIEAAFVPPADIMAGIEAVDKVLGVVSGQYGYDGQLARDICKIANNSLKRLGSRGDFRVETSTPVVAKQPSIN